MTESEIESTLRTAYAHHQSGQHALAETLYQKVLAGFPDNPDALQLLGMLANQTNRPLLALNYLSRVIALHPNVPRLHLELAHAQRALHQPDAAIASYHRVLALDPNSLPALVNLGAVLTDKNQLNEAITILRRAVARHPTSHEAHVNLGSALKSAAQIAEAITVLTHALSLKENCHITHNNLASALLLNGDLDEAATHLRRAIDLNRSYPEAHNNLAITLKNQGFLTEALAAHDRAITLAPNDPDFLSNRLYALHFDPHQTAASLLHEHQKFNTLAQRLLPQLPDYQITRLPDAKSPAPIKLAFISPDLRFHSVAFFLLPFLQHHDRTQFHITCYATNPVTDHITTQIQKLSDQFTSIAHLSHTQAAEKIRHDQIDILIDLAGHSANSRLLTLAQKPAPLQISWLGYPGTTGLSAIDFRLSDNLADPPEISDPFSAEKIARLPTSAWCFHPLSGSPPINPLPALTSPHITLGTFNALPKISQPNLELWAKILHQLPNARLLLKNNSMRSQAAITNLLNFFASKNIPATRLELIPWQDSFSDHLLAYNRLDIALDTFPYNGTTTTCEALHMGVPVITLAGQTHASRVGTSLLTNANLPHLIAQTPEQYLQIVTALAADLPALANLRNTLRQQLQSSPLMNAPQFTRDFEAALQTLRQSRT